MEELNKFIEYNYKICDLEYIINLLNWELRINANECLKEYIIKQITNTEEKLYKLKTATEYETLINDCIKSNNFQKLPIEEQRYILNIKRRYDQNKKIPKDFYLKYIEICNVTNMVWETAKKENNYEKYKPYLNDMLKMTKQYYSYISNGKNLYDTMLEQYEINVTSETIDRLFNKLKEFLIPFIKDNITKESDKLEISYTEEELKSAAKYLLDYIGFDMNKGSLGIYPHGYTEKICNDDVRIAFRHTTDPIDFVTTIIHEGGHGIFEQNINKELSKYTNECVENLNALHESQSRFYENILGRNINFWIPIYDDIKKMLKLDLTLEEFYKRLNQIKPSLIRVEADEVTYCLHIIIRYEIERDLFLEKITIDDLPTIWNNKMKEYLNVEVDSDSNGLMQDVHWSEGEFGYFPSYLLGTIYDGMFIEALEENFGSIDNLLKEGKIKEITKYLINNIYCNGEAYCSEEVINRVCGKELSEKPIINYFVKKYKKTNDKK